MDPNRKKMDPDIPSGVLKHGVQENPPVIGAFPSYKLLSKFIQV
jgi:hypothetical protein